jgi:DNA-directed RNA polymerase beta subunit
LKLEKIDIVDKKQKSTELAKSDLSIVKITLVDEKLNKKHEVELEIPKINTNTGTFRLNGSTKCLLNQMIQCPITFPKPGSSRFESSYAIFRIENRKLRKEEYFEIRIGSYKLPFAIFAMFSFGFYQTLKKYNIQFEFVDKKPPKSHLYFVEVEPGKYIKFLNIDSKFKKSFVRSFIRNKFLNYNIKEEFGTNKYFEKLLIKMTGRINSTFILTSTLQNIVDPVVKQILIVKVLPSDIENIMFYMCKKCADGYVIERNDVNNLRIRNSEVLVHLAQKQILAAHNTFKEQILSGNDDAKFIFSSTKVLSDFLTLELVMDMEYANPIEEMGSITKVAPLGKSVGGIPSKRAISIDHRNLHSSYYGNIDPLDTPEGGTIGISQQLTIDALITSARGLMQSKEMKNDERSGILSTTTCMSPFLETNDGARVIMVANQARQMLPLLNPSKPAIQSGYESILTNVLSDNFLKKSPCNGKVKSIKDNKIIIECTKGEEQEIDISPIHLRSGTGKNTLSVFKPKVKVNDIIKENIIIAEGGCIQDGMISLGNNLCIAYMPYKGYNFEDGIVISESLAKSGKLTSVHGIIQDVLLSEKDQLNFIANIGDDTKKGDPLIKKISGNIGDLIGFDEEDDMDNIGGQLIIKSPGGKIVDIEVYSNASDNSKFPLLEKYIKKTDKKYQKNRTKYTDRGNTIKDIRISFKIEQTLPIGIGDKLTNRYGGKGIISYIEKEELMPKTPTGDTIEVILNPTGIIGRMNMGQLFELYCGLISKTMARLIIKMTTIKELVALLEKTISVLDTTKNKSFSNEYINKIKKMSSVEFKKFIDEINKFKFFPIIIPPFQAPHYTKIIQVLKNIGLKESYYLTLPEFKIKTLNKVAYGYGYLTKLEHMGDAKIYGRSIGPVTGKTAQPTQGKKRGGGQRLGEGDVASLISYDCLKTLVELSGPLSDDFITKDELINEIIETGNAKFRTPKIVPAKNLLNSYFISLMLTRN